MQQEGKEHHSGHHGPPPVAPLELFFDLVFVFVLSQITHLIEEDLTPGGIFRGLVLFVLLWSVWIAFAWVGNAHRAEDHDDGGIPRRLVIILAMALLISLGMILPDSLSTLAIPAALLYAALFILYVVDYFIATAHDPAMRRAVIRVTAVQTILPIAVLIAAFFAMSTWGLVIVIVAMVIAYAIPAITRDQDWQFSATHADERFSLLMLIVMGESLIAIGAGAADGPFGWLIISSVVLGVIIVASLWWQYFDVVAHQGAVFLDQLPEHRRVTTSRVIYSYLHILLVIGVILMALGLHAASADPDHPIPPTQAIFLPGGIALFLATLAVIRYLMRGRIMWPLPVTALVILLVIPLARVVPAIVAELACVIVLVVLIAAREIYTRRGVIQRIH